MFLLPAQRCGNWSMPHLLIPSNATPPPQDPLWHKDYFELKAIQQKQVCIFKTLSACLAACRMCIYKGIYLSPCQAKGKPVTYLCSLGGTEGSNSTGQPLPPLGLGCAPAHVSRPGTELWSNVPSLSQDVKAQLLCQSPSRQCLWALHGTWVCFCLLFP